MFLVASPGFYASNIPKRSIEAHGESQGKSPRERSKNDESRGSRPSDLKFYARLERGICPYQPQG